MRSIEGYGFIRRFIDQAKKRFSSYVLVGLLNTVLGYGLFALLYFLAGSLIGFIGVILLTHVLATSIGYFNLFRFTFSDSPSKFAWLKYQAFYLIPLATNLIAVPLLVEIFQINTYLAQGIFTVFYGAFAYFYHLVVTFRTTKNRE
jgi:putative flippase GtrA